MAKCLLFLAGYGHLLGHQGFKPELNQGPGCLSQLTTPQECALRMRIDLILPYEEHESYRDLHGKYVMPVVTV